MFYKQQVQELKVIFGRPAPSEYSGKIYTRIKKVGNEYLPMVKFGFFGKWRAIGWHFYNEQPGLGLAEMKASTKSAFRYHAKDLVSAIELIEDYKKYRGSGITIW